MSTMSPRPRDPEVAVRMVEAAAHLLAREGPGAVTARRLAATVGTSTMAVYTHFGSMDEVMAAVLRTGFQRFGAALDRPVVTEDPVADWMAQGWEYRGFALANPDLYRVMFGSDAFTLRSHAEADQEAAAATFLSLLKRIERCVQAQRWQVDDLFTAGEVVWAGVHGHCAIEMTGYFDAVGRRADGAYAALLSRLALGFGDQPDAVHHSIERARSRTAADVRGPPPGRRE